MKTKIQKFLLDFYKEGGWGERMENIMLGIVLFTTFVLVLGILFSALM